MSKEYYACHCTVDTCRNPTGGKFRKLMLDQYLWLLQPNRTPFTCPDCKFTFIPEPLPTPGEEAIIRRRPFAILGCIEVPNDLLLCRNPFQKDTTPKHRYLCYCTNDTVSDSAARATGGWCGSMRYWWLEPSDQPFTCPHCHTSFIPCIPDTPETEDVPWKRPL